jgi:hypothetical protein
MGTLSKEESDKIITESHKKAQEVSTKMWDILPEDTMVQLFSVSFLVGMFLYQWKTKEAQLGLHACGREWAKPQAR